jgi:hypothetical protein
MCVNTLLFINQNPADWRDFDFVQDMNKLDGFPDARRTPHPIISTHQGLRRNVEMIWSKSASLIAPG